MVPGGLRDRPRSGGRSRTPRRAVGRRRGCPAHPRAPPCRVGPQPAPASRAPADPGNTGDHVWETEWNARLLVRRRVSLRSIPSGSPRAIGEIAWNGPPATRPRNLPERSMRFPIGPSRAIRVRSNARLLAPGPRRLGGSARDRAGRTGLPGGAIARRPASPRGIGARVNRRRSEGATPVVPSGVGRSSVPTGRPILHLERCPTCRIGRRRGGVCREGAVRPNRANPKRRAETLDEDGCAGAWSAMLR
jgi:hypothetical protein